MSNADEHRQVSGDQLDSKGAVVRVVILESTFQQMDQLAHENTDREYGGVLVGHRRQRRNVDGFDFVVERFVPIPQEPESPNFAVSAQAWNEFSHQLAERFPDQEILGWMHTHPGFGVFLSSLDKEQHRRLFGQQQALAYVIDAQLMNRAFYLLRDGEFVRVTEYFTEQQDAGGKRVLVRKGGPAAASPRRRKASKQSRNGLVAVLLLLAFIGFWWAGAQYLNQPPDSHEPGEESTRVDRTDIDRTTRDPEVSAIAVQPEPSEQEEEVEESMDMEAADATVDEPADDEPAFEEYTVERGDSLWTIAGNLLGDPTRFRELAEINGLAENSVLRQGQVLKIPRD